MKSRIKSITLILIISLTVNKLLAQIQWYPATLVNKMYVRDTVKYLYPVNYIIERNGKIDFYGRGTRYPTQTKYDKKDNAYVAKDGIILTTRKENDGYYKADYRFKKISKNTAKLFVKKKGEKVEVIIYVKSLLPVAYPKGN